MVHLIDITYELYFYLIAISGFQWQVFIPDVFFLLQFKKLNLALNDKENAKRDYINAVKKYWYSYYDIRKLTLFDFEVGEEISDEFMDFK